MTAASGEEITELLAAVAAGEPGAAAQLTPLVYGELRRIAAREMRREKPGHTLQPTALVHEAYLRLVRTPTGGWQSRAHFYGVAARLMRQILVDHARARLAQKRGAGAVRVDLDDLPMPGGRAPEFLLHLDQALDRLAERGPRQAEIVEMRFFAGLSEEETAEVLGISARTVKRDWRLARAWLFREMSG